MTTTDKKSSKLNVLILSDGRPGHFNKSRAVVRALRSQFVVAETWLEIELRIAWARPLIASILNMTGKEYRCAWLLRIVYRMDCPKQVEPVDLILSTGGNTMFANVLFARHLGCPNLFIGGLRSILPRNFWRIIHHRAYQPAPPHLQWPMTLVNIDRRELVKEADDLRCQLGLNDESYWAFLLGGNGNGYSYSMIDMDDIARLMQRAYEQDGRKWLIASSRRTGIENENYLKSLLAPEWLAATTWAGDDGINYYRAFLGLAERIVCTEDSHMMMTEAIAAGKPVLALRPRHGEATNRDFLVNYEADGLIARQSIKQAVDHGYNWPEIKVRRHDVDLDALGELLANALTSPLH